MSDAVEILNIELITRATHVRGGRPVIRDTTLEVVDVVLVKLYQRLDADELAAWFEIGPAEIHAALAYYYLHKDEIDSLIQTRAKSAEALKELLRDRRPASLY